MSESRDGADEPASTDAEEPVPALFATSGSALTPDLEAIAAIIDEDEPPARIVGGKRKVASLGTAQVQLALATCDEAPAASCEKRARRTAQEPCDLPSASS